MSDVFEMDVNGDGVDDLVVAETYADGSVLSMADTDGDGEADVLAYDADGDGVPEEIYDSNDDSPAAATPAEESAGYGSDYASDSAGYADPAAVSDALAAQHETNMAIINNI